ncbi:MAG: tRNA (5-methylaminomethyl-2-thiouridine)(34)-methyltransferase MnmD [Candidatus Nanoarchaeia archaeon]
MEELITRDSSVTFYNKEYEDIYHSKSGAIEEATEKFARPALEHIKRIGKKEITLLDICFGLGYNSCAVIDLVKENIEDFKISITGIEKDIKIIEKIKEIQPEFKNYNLIKKARNGNVKEESIFIQLIIKDALEVIENLNEKYDIVFHDPFAPKKHPELWTKEFFVKVSSCMNRGGKLYTYSCARSVRDALKEAGFSIEDGPKVGRRAPSTIATL